MPKIKDGRPAKPTAELTQVGKLLRKIRGKLSQAEAAERIGKSSDWWRQRECRVGDCSVAEIAEICLAFDRQIAIRRGQAMLATP